LRGGIGAPERQNGAAYLKEKDTKALIFGATGDPTGYNEATSSRLVRADPRRVANFSGHLEGVAPVCPPAQLQREEFSGDREIGCLLVHDHVLLRQGLRRLLEDEPDMEVVGEAGNASEALRKTFEYRPAIVITDAHIFESSADQTERLILRESPCSKVLFLTTHEGDDLQGEERADATSCLVRQTSAEELVEMVRRTHRAQRTGAPEAMEKRREEWRSEEWLPRKRVLTTREREVLKLLAEGRTVRSAADVLGLSMKTVDAHKFNLMRKLGIHNKAELVMWAIQKKVVKVPANF
jgi:two-component system, NarL family, response regulator NreC